MNTAIVLLNWNGKSYLNQFLPILLQHSDRTDVTIYVVDNGSTDESLELLATNFPRVKTIVLDKNYGFAGGYNRALDLIQADYYVLLNSDVEVTPHWLDPMLEYMNTNPDVAACQPKILSYLHRTHFEHAGAAGGFIDYLGYPFCRGRIFATVEEDIGQYNSITDIFWATGACLLIRAIAFHECGGFDDEFFAHMEEVDLCWRLRSRAHRIVCVPQSTVYHMGGGTLNVEHPHKTYLNFRNNLLLLYKNLPQNKLFPVLFLRFFLDYIAAIQLYMTGKPNNAWAVLKARKDFKKMKPSFKLKRKEYLENTVQAVIPEISSKSILLNYYILGRKKFSELYGNSTCS